MKSLQNLSSLNPCRWFFQNVFPSPACSQETKLMDDGDGGATPIIKLKCGYNPIVEKVRDAEYPLLRDTTYLDHAGTTLYASSLINAISQELNSNLFGNPHSQSPSSQLTTKRIKDTRLRVLRLLNADPDDFDVVFCANATAGMKLVIELMSGQKARLLEYRFHKDAHTSMVGIRELANSTYCFTSDEEVDQWLLEQEQRWAEAGETENVGLFAWPAQSNFSGRRLPRDWARKLRVFHPNYLSLLDAASMATTAPIDLNFMAPDFTVLSFYKIFGFPDLGALVIRKSSSQVQRLLQQRQYFGGGTVAAVVAAAQSERFHVKRNDSPHQHLEDGTPAFHSILALDHAMSIHEKLYGGFSNISEHTSSLVSFLYESLSRLVHGNGKNLCVVYSDSGDFKDPIFQGPIICFNMKRADGSWVGYAEVEKLAAVKKIHIRTGGLCNPGGVESYIGLQSWEIRQNYEAGHRCWDDQDIMRGKPTGAIRVSLGAMSTLGDVEKFIAFLEEFYIDKCIKPTSDGTRVRESWRGVTTAVVESLNIYPIKSCGAFKIPAGLIWEVKPHGLVWDREWCVVHLGTGFAIDQKRYPKMALIRPVIDIPSNLLIITAIGSTNSISVPLNSLGDDQFSNASENDSMNLETKLCPSRVCGDKITAISYRSSEIIDFFSDIIGVPSTLARFPPSGDSKRYFKPHLAMPKQSDQSHHGGEADEDEDVRKRRSKQILLSNESPILIINRSSIDKLNEDIRFLSSHRTNTVPPKLAKAEVFRANIIISPIPNVPNTTCLLPFAEDSWSYIQIGKEYFELLGPCRRCHMVCIDQDTGEKNEEPLVTLSKTRRREEGKVMFGQHAAHVARKRNHSDPVGAFIKVGDSIRVWEDHEGEEELRNLTQNLS